ncbi:hypothetical protein F0562_002046 [Nyssa sinensis]|uniref:AT-hook motif nuclear-localized protein n=1 Tax=Nyssa sinensis TaxID=561372 RepID=A0A5J5C8M5_9ASTE|nr:hypothetical protein F0562_002046 [Nyssa sinensis]
MEAREGMISSVNVIGAEEPSNSTQVAAAPPAVASPASLGNKKRGRPRKYGPDGANTRAFTTMPISSRVPPATANFSAEENNQHHKMGLGRNLDLGFESFHLIYTSLLKFMWDHFMRCFYSDLGVILGL